MITEGSATKEELEINPYLNYLNFEDKGFIKYSLIYDKIEIENIEVKEKYRNQGIASKLIEYLINLGEKRKIINITLEAKETNSIAIHLYKKFGFIPVAKRKKYYNGIDGILMIKEMK